MKIHIHVTESVNLAHTADLIWLTETEMDEMPYPLASGNSIKAVLHETQNNGLFYTAAISWNDLCSIQTAEPDGFYPRPLDACSRPQT